MLRSVDTAEEALAEVERGRRLVRDHAVRDQNDGAVTATLNLLARSDAKVCAEIRIRRAFHLISQSGERDAGQEDLRTSSALAACEATSTSASPRR